MLTSFVTGVFSADTRKCQSYLQVIYDFLPGKKLKDLTFQEVIEMCNDTLTKIYLTYHQETLTWDFRHWQYAICYQNSLILEQFQLKGFKGDTKLNIGKATLVYGELYVWDLFKHGRIDGLKFLIHAGCQGLQYGADLTVWYDQLEAMDYLYQRGYPCTCYGANFAASRGNLELVKHLHQWGIDCDQEGLRAAQENGCQDIVDYLRNEVGIQISQGYDELVTISSDNLHVIIQDGNTTKNIEGVHLGNYLHMIEMVYDHEKCIIKQSKTQDVYYDIHEIARF